MRKRLHLLHSKLGGLLQKKGTPTSSGHSDLRLQVGLINSIPGVLDFPFSPGGLLLKIYTPKYADNLTT
jgi:hypothetical protein